MLSECAHNILKGTVNLTPAQYKKLKKYKLQLRVLANKKASAKKKKSTIQKGGFIGALLGALLPVLTELVGSFLTPK